MPVFRVEDHSQQVNGLSRGQTSAQARRKRQAYRMAMSGSWSLEEQVDSSFLLDTSCPTSCASRLLVSASGSDKGPGSGNDNFSVPRSPPAASGADPTSSWCAYAPCPTCLWGHRTR
eukprot:763731-Hanusia_phi.AAC.2